MVTLATPPPTDGPAAAVRPATLRRPALRRRTLLLADRIVRASLRRYVRATPREDGGDGRVTILLGSAWGMGGTIRTVLNLAGYLSERHEVEILSVMRRRESPFFELPPGVEVTALDDQRPGATPAGLRSLRRLMRTRRSVLMPRETRPFAECSLWTDVQLARRLRRRSGILISSHVSLNLLAANLRPPGLITIGQEHMHLGAYPRRIRRQMADRYPELDALVVLTDQDATAFSDAGAKPIRLAVIPNTVRQLEGGPSLLTEPTVLAAGRLTPQKGFDLLIHAFARFCAQQPEWRLRICGAGGQVRELQRLIDALGVADVVDLEGPARRLGDEMRRASVFALSSRFEGMPLVLLEAMSKGMAVVSFDCPTGPREVIEDHRNGILVPAGDVEAFSRALLELAQDEELRRRLGTEAMAVAQTYSAAALGERWETLISELRTARRGARSESG